MKGDYNEIQTVTKLLTGLVVTLLLTVILTGITVGILYVKPSFFSNLTSIKKNTALDLQDEKAPVFWKAPDINNIPLGNSGDSIRYGRELIMNTAEYLGPQGKILKMSNGMNCQNCHLEAGTKMFGNNYSAVASTYPKFRARSGSEETIEKRVNDCFERSLNGKALPEESHEMRAIVSYIKWLGTDVTKGETPAGAGLTKLAYLKRAADPIKGKILYEEKCSVCHGADGQGVKDAEAHVWTYPPLWGKNSYNNGAGLFRLSRFASYIKTNMPLGASYENPVLSDEEAWDIAAYVNSMERPAKDIRNDWPDISKKPVDHPFGPFADEFSEEMHKLGPFEPIENKRAVIKQKEKKQK